MVTVTITPRQASMLMNALQSGDAVVNIKESTKRGQKGGFMPLLAALAAPVVGSLLSGAVDKMMGKGPTITVTPRQFKVLSQAGRGIPLEVNFKVSKSKRHSAIHSNERGTSMIGAGMLDFLPKLVMSAAPALFRKVIGSSVGQSLAQGVASKAKEVGSKLANSTAKKVGEKVVDKAKSLFARKKPEAVVVSEQAALPTPTASSVGGVSLPQPRKKKGSGVSLAGHGVRLAGHGVNLAGHSKKKYQEGCGHGEWKIARY